ncbi:hypothetical protein NPIL_517901 [Nephila pilipes]|uniref:Uncharacterized protein n=1 Tax=Nephila pilipes TaxID=299642 RepID=A0A8X6NSR1_NEPPI|nr:hypothetical protein NPIL_517901 [Nephila pilipes]
MQNESFPANIPHKSGSSSSFTAPYKILNKILILCKLVFHKKGIPNEMQQSVRTLMCSIVSGAQCHLHKEEVVLNLQEPLAAVCVILDYLFLNAYHKTKLFVSGHPPRFLELKLLYVCHPGIGHDQPWGGGDWSQCGG